MAWTCSGRTNAEASSPISRLDNLCHGLRELIDKLVDNGLIQSMRVAEAMRKVDRRHYVPDPDLAYEDSPQVIGFGATISAPHMHAHAVENLLPLLESMLYGEGAILDVGCGSGYLTAVLSHLAPKATVVGIDHIPGLTEMTRTNLKADGIMMFGTTDAKILVVTGDGRKGYPDHAPYRVIHVGAAAPEIPADLVDQLAKPGRMFIPVGTTQQDIWQVDKSTDGSVTKKKLFGVRYVPLTDAQSQWSG